MFLSAILDLHTGSMLAHFGFGGFIFGAFVAMDLLWVMELILVAGAGFEPAAFRL